MSKRKKLLIIPAVILAIPLLMWLFWLCTPKTKLVAAIIDKTVLTTSGQEHISLTWILNHQKFTKTTTKPYKIAEDYFGFFPLEKENYRLKGLERFNPEQLNQLSEDADLVYFTDTYGIYKNEWSTQANNTERSGMLYGGMSSQDIELLTQMKAKGKLIITEFNSIGSPTHLDTRRRFESLFAMRWTGWTGRFFENLDSAKNKELPKWLINNYKRDNNNQWPFKKAGVAFVNDNDQVVILEDSTDLKDPIPHITSTKYGQQHFGLPDKIKYTFWFDVVDPSLNTNTPVANFNVDVNAKGRKLLSKYNLPAVFPAVIMHKDKDYRFYYFSGDFCDNPITMATSYFKGISFFQWMFYNNSNPMERSSFFWKFYRPMVTTILKEEKEFKRQ
jgi:hypothetical protein